jgi:hypothetical protein
LGANGFLVKPSEASKLEEMVKAIRDFWLSHNTLPQECLAPGKTADSSQPAASIGRADRPWGSGKRREEWPIRSEVTL